MANPLKEKCFKLFDCINEYSLYLLVFFIPISTAGIESFFGFLLVSFIIKKFIKPDFSFLKSSSSIFLIFFVVFISSSLIYSGTYLAKSFTALFFKWFEYILIFIIAQDALSNRRRIKNIIIVLLFGLGLTCISGLSQRFLGFEFLRHRPLVGIEGGFYGITGPFQHYNDFGSYLVVVSFIVMGLLLARIKPITKIMLIGLLCLSLLCIFLTFSRGSFLGLVSVLILMLIVSHKFKASVFLLLLFVIVLSFLPGTKERLVSTFQIGGDTERFAVWRGTWAMIKDNPFLGKGIGTFMDYFPKYIPGLTTRYAHNCFLQIWAETGIFGLLSFLGFLGVIFWKSIKTFRRNSDFILLGIICAVFGFLIHSFFDNQLYSLQLAVLFWFMLGLLLARTNLSNGKN